MTIQAFLLAFGCGALVALSTRHLIDSEPDTPCSGAQPAASRAVDWHAVSATGLSPVAAPGPLAARLALLKQLVADMAVDVAPTLYEGVVAIPGHRMALGAPGASYWSSFAKAHADAHVKEAIISVLGGGRCNLGARRAVAVDLGANVGQFSLFMRAMGCRVIAVEPQPAMNLVHKASLALNGWLDDATVTLHEMATSSAPGSIKLTKLWSRSLVEAEEQWDRDLWAPSHQGIRQSKRRLLELIKEGYDEIARPLEPFVVIFIFFGVPACVMATDFCQESSQVKENGNFATHITVGKCDVVCELILAFRSMATVAVYFYPREHRTEVYHVRVMWRRLRARVSGWFRLGTSRRGSGVTFRGIMLEEVQMINAIGDECDDCKVDDDGDGDSRVARSTVPYQLMDTDDGAIASKNM